MSKQVEQVELLVEQVAVILTARNWMVTAVESCTGGWIAQALTSKAGSSQWFERGFVTYSNEAKRQLVGVRQETLLRHGAVSCEVVREMSLGGIASSHADVAVSVTGIAGPSGGVAGKPVGTVWIGWANKKGESIENHYIFAGSRTDIRLAAVKSALAGTVEFVERYGN